MVMWLSSIIMRNLLGRSQEGGGRLSSSAIHDGSSFDPIGVAHLPQHFNHHTRSVALDVELLATSFFSKTFNCSSSSAWILVMAYFHMVIGHKWVAGKIAKVVHFTKDLTIKASTSRMRSISSPKNSTWKACSSRGSWETSTTSPRTRNFPPLKVNIIALKLDVHQVIEQTIMRNSRPGRLTTLSWSSVNPNHRYKRQKRQRSHRYALTMLMLSDEACQSHHWPNYLFDIGTARGT